RSPRAQRILTLSLLLAALAAAGPAFAQDVDPPVIEVLEGGTALTEGSLFNRSVTPTIQVTDASATTVDATLDGAPFTSGTTVSGEGLHELAVTATDDAGNSSSLLRTFVIDTVAPVLGDVLPVSGTLTSAAEITLQGQAIGAASVSVDGQAATLAGETFTAGPFPLAEGERTFTLTAADAAGNTAQITHRIVRDSTPPSVSIDQPLAGALQKATPIDVVGSVSDPHLESVTVNGTEAPVTGSTFLARHVPLAEGGTTVVAEARDAAGNGAQATRTVVLDTQPPALAVTDPAAGTVVPSSTLAVSGTATDPHLDRVEVAGVAAQLAGSSWSATVPLAEGPNTLEVRAHDRLGWSAATTVAVTRDSTAPPVAITSPADGAYLQGDAVTVQGTVGEEAGLTVTVNGVAATLDTTPTPDAFTALGVPLVEGENRLIARVTDSLGNHGAHSRLVYRDTVAPTLLRSEPGDGALSVPPESRFELTFSEPLGTLAPGAWSLERADGQTIPAQGTTDGAVLVIQPDDPLPSKTDLRLVLTAGIIDRAGNPLAAPPTLTFVTRDVVAPAAPVLAAQPPGHLCAPELALTGTAEAEAVVSVRGGAGGASTRAAEDGSFSLVVELLPGGLNRLEVTATDLDGNPSDALILEVVQDCEAPRVVSSALTGDDITISFDEPVDPTTVPGAVS
ncbi:MAG TPA: Ig-like domain-containing protein, partial [Thermoanaerobaculia bacterium]|nr:Ig-like domain-containing protein [Thermoanaerobaculia bacterium]